MNWLFSPHGALPAGHRRSLVNPECLEFGRLRFEEAARVLGPEGARQAALRVGPYALVEHLAHRLGLAGVSLGENGEVPALSPTRWLEIPASDLRAGEELVGLALSPTQRESFRRFLTRNHERDPGAERAVRLARHFFFREPFLAIARYTPPRFANS